MHKQLPWQIFLIGQSPEKKLLEEFFLALNLPYKTTWKKMITRDSLIVDEWVDHPLVSLAQQHRAASAKRYHKIWTPAQLLGEIEKFFLTHDEITPQWTVFFDRKKYERYIPPAAQTFCVWLIVWLTLGKLWFSREDIGTRKRKID